MTAQSAPKVASLTHFDLFGLPRRYPIDAAGLEKRFRALSLKLHPDRTASPEPKQRLKALEETTRLNEAYKVLKDPVRRAFYLLGLYGVDLDREDGAAPKEMPPEFLEEVMALREELEAARQTGDLGKAAAMAKAVDHDRQAALESATGALTALERNASDAKALQQASDGLGRVRYFTRFLEEVEAIQEALL